MREHSFAVTVVMVAFRLLVLPQITGVSLYGVKWAKQVDVIYCGGVLLKCPTFGQFYV
jgi:hypothetical protein